MRERRGFHAANLMKNKTLMMALALFLLVSCAAPQTSPITIPVSTATPQANMPNPASAYCEQQGNKLEIRTAADGSQSGVCIFPDGSECDEWAYFRKECGPGQFIATPIQDAQSTGDIIAAQAVSMPAGVIINPYKIQSGMTGSLVFYAPDGSMLGEMSAPYADKVHAAGAYQGALNFPLVFHSFDTVSRQQSLKVIKDGQVADILSLSERSMVSNLVGVPGEPTISFTAFQPVDSSLQTQFFFGSVDSMPAVPAFTLDSAESRYWKVVAVQMRDGASPGIWFTRAPWGIGGDIVFMYQEGLSHLEVVSGKVTEVLSTDATFSSLSPDQTWVAYNIRKEGGGSDFFIRNLTGGEPILIPPLPESDRGAGDGLFSPSNKYFAWREAQGSLMDGNFHETIRIATLDGQTVNNFADTMFYDVLQPQAVQTSKIPLPQFGEGTQVSPAGWLNDETFLVQATSPEKPHDGALVKVNALTGEMTFFSYGDFAGWFYP
jgi:putative hemolysin